MRINELLDFLVIIFEATFELLQMAENSVNVLIIIMGIIMGIIWVRQMSVYNKEAERNGTLK